MMNHLEKIIIKAFHLLLNIFIFHLLRLTIIYTKAKGISVDWLWCYFVFVVVVDDDTGAVMPLNSRFVLSSFNERWPCCSSILMVNSSVWCKLARKSERAHCFRSLRLDSSGIFRMQRKISRYSFKTSWRSMNWKTESTYTHERCHRSCII